MIFVFAFSRFLASSRADHPGLTRRDQPPVDLSSRCPHDSLRALEDLVHKGPFCGVIMSFVSFYEFPDFSLSLSCAMLANG
jgi:hypothetical protein